MAATDVPAPSITTAQPLTSAAVDTKPDTPSSSSGGTAANKQGGGKKTPAPTPTPIPTPKPKQDTKECSAYHTAKANPSTNPKILAALEAKCRSSGGTP